MTGPLGPRITAKLGPSWAAARIGTRVLFGAVVTAEAEGSVELGARCIVMENAVIRGRPGHPIALGNDVIVGPHAHVNGATIGERLSPRRRPAE